MTRASEREKRAHASGTAALWRAVVSCGWVLGVSSCNALLGIGDASLRCDSDPCPPDIASVGALAPHAPDEAPPGAAEPSASTGASGDGVIVGVPPLQSPSGGEASGGVDAPDEGTASGGGASGAGPTGAGEGLAGTGGVAGQSPAPDAGGEPTASACNRDDACGLCLCGACREEFDACDRTPGCIEILACARLTGCIGFDCYCGSVDAITCGSRGRGNGPCLDATLAAPGSHEPTLVNPSAGPASDAALAFGNCATQDTLCISACRN